MAQTDPTTTEFGRRSLDDGGGQANIQHIDETGAQDDVGQNSGVPDEGNDTDGYRKICIVIRSAIPDATETIEDHIAAGNTVCRQSWYRGTHWGEFASIEHPKRRPRSNVSSPTRSTTDSSRGRDGRRRAGAMNRLGVTGRTHREQ